ncbi:hypothetical protein KNE206_65030 [Kitasatospora sp. NE20-6]
METAATTCVRSPESLTGGAKLSEAATAQSSYGLFAGRISTLAGSTS